jgi:cullin 1
MALAPRAMNVAPGPKGVKPLSFEDGWSILEKKGIRRLQKIVERGSNIKYKNEDFVDLYTTIYKMCTQKAPHNWSGKLYFAHRKSIEQYLSDKVAPACMDKKSSTEAFLNELHQSWVNHKMLLKWQVKLFAYVNRFYVRRLAIDDLHTVGMKAFQKIVFEEAKTLAAKAVVQLIARERNNGVSNALDQRIIRDITEMYLIMGNGNDRVYEEFLEKPILIAAKQESKSDAEHWASKYGLANYLQRCETRLEEETDRVHYYLRKSTLPKLVKVCEEELLTNAQESVLEDESSGGMAELLKGYCRRDLLRLYRLYSRVPNGLEVAAKHFRLYVTREVMQTIGSVHVKELVDNLIKLLASFERLVEECFHGDNIFKEAMNSGFEKAANTDVKGKKKMTELVADAIDRALRSKPKSARGGEALGSIGSLAYLDNVTTIFVYLRDKDVFSEFYRKQLAKRLLLGRSGGDDMEQRVLSNLKARCGAQYTAKFEGMLNDMRLAADVQNDFTDYLADPEALTEKTQGELTSAPEDQSPQKKAKSIDPSQLQIALSVNVLTQGFWPTYKHIDFVMAKDLQIAKSIFEQFYCLRTANRKLRWVHTLGSIVVQGTFNNSLYTAEMTMSTFQACILLLFNRWDAQSPTGVAQALKMSLSDLNKQLMPLVFGKYKILKTVNDGVEGPKLQSSERVCVNHHFSEKQKRIRIPLAIAKTSDKERDDTTGDVRERRKHQMEATIVRIMKSKEKIKHDDLVTETIKMLKPLFQASADMLKPRIEDLISRDYLERSDDDPNLYEYVA